MSSEALTAPSISRGDMKTIARLNDEFRSTFEDGRVLVTSEVNALSVELRAAAIVAVQAFTAFTKEDDHIRRARLGKLRAQRRTLRLDDRLLRRDVDV